MAILILPKILAMNKVNTQDRSFRMDWPAILPYFNTDANNDGVNHDGSKDTVEDRVTRASGEHLVRIFVQRCHKLWKQDDVVQWMYKCSERVVKEHQQQKAPADASSEAQDSVPAPQADGDDTTKNTSPLISKFFPALARYAQCDPSEYEDAFRTFPPEAIALDPNIVAPAMALGVNGRRRFIRRGQQQQQQQRNGGGAGEGQDPLEVLRQMLGFGGGAGDGEVEVLDPDSPLLQLYLQSLLPWAQVEGVRPPPR